MSWPMTCRSSTNGRQATSGCRDISSPPIKLSIKAVPASSRNCVAGWLGDTLKIRVTAPAERGKANAAVEKTLAEALGLPKGSVRIVSGRTSARKVAEVMGMSESDVYQRLSKRVD